MSETPKRQIRAVHDSRTIRVYQAYNYAIADKALARRTLSDALLRYSKAVSGTVCFVSSFESLEQVGVRAEGQP